MLKYKDLIERLTIEQKLSLLISKDMYKTNEISTFDIPSIDLNNPKVDNNKKRTIFPGLKTIGNTWDSQILKEYGEAKALEAGASIMRISVEDIFSEQSYLNANLLDSYIYGMQQSGALICLEGSFDWTDSAIESYYPTINQVAQRRKPDAVIAGEQLIQRLDKANYNGLVMSVQNREDLIVRAFLLGASIVFTVNDDAEAAIIRALEAYATAKDRMSQVELSNLLNEGVAISEEILNTRLDSLLDYILLCKTNTISKQYSINNHNSLAMKIAQEGSVLLKNDMVLPLNYKTKVALIGSAVENSNEQAYIQESFFTAASKYDANVIGYAHGYYLDHKDNMALVEAAERLALDADVAVVYIELDGETELPEDYMRLITALCLKDRKPIVVLSSADLIEMSFLKYASALIWCAGGQGSATALLDLIYGTTNPCGRMSCSFTSGKDASFELGFGLGYCYYSYSKLKLSNAGAEFIITNASDRDGYEIPQLYISNGVSRKELKGYVKIFLRAKESAKVFIPFDEDTFATYQRDTQEFKIVGGDYTVLIGRSIEDIELEATISIANSGSLANTDIDMIDESLDLNGDIYKPVKPKGSSLSLGIILCVYFLLAAYINFLCISYMISSNGNALIAMKIAAASVLAVVDLGFIILTIMAIAKKSKQKRNVNYTLSSIVQKASDFNEIARVTYDEPVEQPIIEQEEQQSEKEEDANVVKQYHIDDDIDEESFNALKQNDTISFDLIYNDIMCLLKENEVGIEPAVLRGFIAALSSAKTLYITTSAFEQLCKFLNVICVYFDVPFYYTDITGRTEGHDMLWEEEDDQYVLSNFSRSVMSAEALRNHLNFTCITGVDQQNIATINSLWKTYLAGNLNLEQEENVKYEKNIFRIIIVDTYDVLKELRKRDYEESAYLDITPYDIPAEVLNREYMSLGYTLFMDSIEEVRKSNYLDEKYWKKVDEIEEEFSKAKEFTIGNKLTIQMEIFSSVLLGLTEDENEVLDSMIAQNLVLYLLSLDSSKKNSQVLQVIEKVCSEDESILSRKYIKKLISSKEE